MMTDLVWWKTSAAFAAVTALLKALVIAKETVQLMDTIAMVFV
jgi:hypothetical protein